MVKKGGCQSFAGVGLKKRLSSAV